VQFTRPSTWGDWIVTKIPGSKCYPELLRQCDIRLWLLPAISCTSHNLLDVIPVLISRQGSYVVHLDDIIWTSSAYSDTYQFGALVYAKSGLDNTYHTLTIVDQGTDPDKRWVDIDNIVYTTGDPALKYVSCPSR
jgi:hypothetical protein